MNLMHDLRRREDLSQQELAKATHLTANDISRCEHHARVGMDKFITLAAYFHVTVDALVMNNYSTVFSKMTAPVKPTHRNSLRMERISARRYELGRLGEEGFSGRKSESWQGPPMPTPSIPIMPMNSLPALIFEAMTWMGNPS